MKKSKRHLLAIIAIILIISMVVIKYNYTANRCKNLNYAVEHYLTSGFFNKYKIDSIKNFDLTFSDGNLSIINVSGIRSKAPNDNVTYRIYAERNKKGLWKINDIYIHRP